MDHRFPMQAISITGQTERVNDRGFECFFQRARNVFVLFKT